MMKRVVLLLMIALQGNFAFASNSKNVDIDAAYKREYIFLMSQIKELKNQKIKLEKDYKVALKNAAIDLEKGQEKIISLNAYNEALEDKMIKLEQSVELGDENKTLLENTLKQAVVNLKLEKEMTGVDLPLIFESSLVQLQKASNTFQEKGTFYLENGEHVEGDLLHLGEIASFGHYQGKYYLLAPAGKGFLKVWREESLVSNIFKGSVPEVFPMFIYEGLDREISKKEGQSLVEFINAGGAIAWVIVAMGLFALLLCIVRAISLKYYAKETHFIEGHFHVSDLIRTKEQLEGHTSRFGQKNLFIKILNLKNHGKDVLNDVIDEGMIHEHKIIDRFGALILVFAAIAPLMGLLGTVTGMISTFDIITEYGTGDPKLLSQGISEALITTELGLLVAIPTLLFGNILSGWGKNIKMTLDKLVLKLVNDL